MQLDPRSPDAWGAQAEVYDAEGRPNDAITSAQGAIDRDPDSWRWPVLLGSYYFEIGKLQLAAEQFRNAIELAPDNSTALLDLGLVSLQLKRPDVAKDSLHKAVQTEPSFAAYSALAELYASQGKYAQSVDFCHKALDLNPTNYRAWGNLGSAYLAVPETGMKLFQAIAQPSYLRRLRASSLPKIHSSSLISALITPSLARPSRASPHSARPSFWRLRALTFFSRLETGTRS